MIASIGKLVGRCNNCRYDGDDDDRKAVEITETPEDSFALYGASLVQTESAKYSVARVSPATVPSGPHLAQLPNGLFVIESSYSQSWQVKHLASGPGGDMSLQPQGRINSRKVGSPTGSKATSTPSSAPSPAPAEDEEPLLTPRETEESLPRDEKLLPAKAELATNVQAAADAARAEVAATVKAAEDVSKVVAAARAKAAANEVATTNQAAKAKAAEAVAKDVLTAQAKATEEAAKSEKASKAKAAAEEVAKAEAVAKSGAEAANAAEAEAVAKAVRMALKAQEVAKAAAAAKAAEELAEAELAEAAAVAAEKVAKSDEAAKAEAAITAAEEVAKAEEAVMAAKQLDRQSSLPASEHALLAACEGAETSSNQKEDSATPPAKQSIPDISLASCEQRLSFREARVKQRLQNPLPACEDLSPMPSKQAEPACEEADNTDDQQVSEEGLPPAAKQTEAPTMEDAMEQLDGHKLAKDIEDKAPCKSAPARAADLRAAADQSFCGCMQGLLELGRPSQPARETWVAAEKEYKAPLKARSVAASSSTAFPNESPVIRNSPSNASTVELVPASFQVGELDPASCQDGDQHELNAMLSQSRAELVTLCQCRGLSSDGNKRALVNRLFQIVGQEGPMDTIKE